VLYTASAIIVDGPEVKEMLDYLWPIMRVHKLIRCLKYPLEFAHATSTFAFLLHIVDITTLFTFPFILFKVHRDCSVARMNGSVGFKVWIEENMNIPRYLRLTKELLPSSWAETGQQVNNALVTTYIYKI
jgi:hypothetical protein